MKKAFFVLISLSIFATASVFAQPRVFQNTPPTSNDANGPKNLTFNPGDEIDVVVPFEKDYNFSAKVGADGTIEVPYAAEPVVAVCKTERQLREDIKNVYKTYLKDPQVNIVVKNRYRPDVTIFGEVLSVTKVVLTRRATLLEMLAQAGGAKSEAGQIVQVYRPVRMTCSGAEDPDNWKPETDNPEEVPSRTFKLTAVNSGQPGNNPVIIPGDVIYVPQASPVYIVGEVRQPGPVLLKYDGGMTLFQAVNLVGGASPIARTKDVKIYRKKPNGEKETLSANLDLIRAGKQKDLFLEPYDVVEVDKAKKSIALTIAEFALGAGKRVVEASANQVGVRVLY